MTKLSLSSIASLTVIAATYFNMVVEASPKNNGCNNYSANRGQCPNNSNGSYDYYYVCDNGRTVKQWCPGETYCFRNVNNGGVYCDRKNYSSPRLANNFNDYRGYGHAQNRNNNRCGCDYNDYECLDSCYY